MKAWISVALYGRQLLSIKACRLASRVAIGSDKNWNLLIILLLLQGRRHKPSPPVTVLINNSFSEHQQAIVAISNHYRHFGTTEKD